MESLLRFCNNISDLTKEAEEGLSSVVSEKSFAKGEAILKEGKVCNKLYFIDSGLVKLFFLSDEKEFVMRFFTENSLMTNLESLVTGIPSTYTITAIEDTHTLLINKADMELLCRQHHCIETFYRKFNAMASINMMKRISEMLESDATIRYNNFVANNRQLINRVSLGDLSSYLGITLASLSRIRARR